MIGHFRSANTRLAVSTIAAFPDFSMITFRLSSVHVCIPTCLDPSPATAGASGWLGLSVVLIGLVFVGLVFLMVNLRLMAQFPREGETADQVELVPNGAIPSLRHPALKLPNGSEW